MAIVTLPPQRGASAGALAVLDGDYKSWVDVLVANGSGTLVSLRNVQGKNLLKSVRWGHGAEQQVATLTVTCRSQVYDNNGVLVSASPLMESSLFNRDDANLYSPGIHPIREVEVRTASLALPLALGQVPGPADWVTVYKGYVTIPDMGGDTVVFQGLDPAHLLQIALLEEDLVIAENGPVTLEAAATSILTAVGYGTLPFGLAGNITLAIDEPLTIPAGTPAFRALEDLAIQVGAALKQRFTGEGTHQLVFYIPDRDNTTPVRTFTSDAYTELPQLSIDPTELKNVVSVPWTDANGVQQPPVVLTNPDSILKFKRRFWQLSLDNAKQIRTQAQATQVATAALADCSAPPVAKRVVFPYRWCVDLDDVYGFAGNGVQYDTTQILAVVGYEHSFEEGEDAPTSTVSLGGQPSGGYRAWLRRRVIPGFRADAGPVDVRVKVRLVTSGSTTQVDVVATAEAIQAGVVLNTPVQVRLIRLVNATRLAGALPDTLVDSGSTWTIELPDTGLGEIEFEGVLPGFLPDTNGTVLPPKGTVFTETAQLQVTLVPEPGPDEANFQRLRATVTDPAAATDPQTLTLTLTGAGLPAGFTLPGPVTGSSPLTLLFLVDRNEYLGGIGKVRATGTAPNRIPDFDGQSIGEKQRDTLTPTFTINATDYGDRVDLVGNWIDPLTGVTLTPDSYEILSGAEFDITTSYYQPPDISGFSGIPWVVSKALFGGGLRRFSVQANKAGYVSQIAEVDIPPQERDTITPRLNLRRGTTWPDRIDVWYEYFDLAGNATTPDTITVIEGATWLDPNFPNRPGTQAVPWVFRRGLQGDGGRNITIRALKAGMVTVATSMVIEPREAPTIYGRIRRLDTVDTTATQERLRFEAIRSDQPGTVTLTITKPDGTTLVQVLSVTTVWGSAGSFLDVTFARPGPPDFADVVSATWTASGMVPGAASYALTDAEGSRRAWAGFNSNSRVVTGLESLADAGGVLVATIAASSRGLFLENFDRTIGNPDELWLKYSASAYSVQAISDPTLVGGSAMRITGEAWLGFAGWLPFNPNSLYRFRFRVRRVSGTSSLYAGFNGRGANPLTLVNTAGLDQGGSQHYVAAQAGQPALGVWTTFTGWVKGAGTWAGPSSNPLQPAVAHPSVRYFSPMFLVNYPNVTTAVTDVDYLAVDEFDADGQVRIYKAIADDGHLNHGTRQHEPNNQIQVRKVTAGHYIVDAPDATIKVNRTTGLYDNVNGVTGIGVTFPFTYGSTPVVIPNSTKGISYEPRAGAWSAGYNAGTPQYDDVDATNVSASGFLPIARMRQKAPPTPKSQTMPGTITTVNGSLTDNLDFAPSNDGKYTVSFEVSITGQGPTTDPFQRTGDAQLFIEIRTIDGTTGVPTARASRDYFFPSMEDTDSGTVDFGTQAVNFNVGDLTNDDDVQIVVTGFDKEYSGSSFVVSNASWSHTISAGDSLASKTPFNGDTARYDVLLGTEGSQ